MPELNGKLEFQRIEALERGVPAPGAAAAALGERPAASDWLGLVLVAALGWWMYRVAVGAKPDSA